MIIKYEDISIEKLLEQNGNGIGIELNEEVFYILVNIKEDSEALVAFSGGALDQTKKKPPVYMRSTWKDDLDQSSIFIDDKTIHGSNLRIGWGIGTKNRHYLKDYYLIVKKVADVLCVNDNNVMYYGSSMGGLMSIIMATMHKGSIALVDNPQTDVFRYLKPSVDRLCKVLFSGMEDKEIESTYPERLRIVETMIKENYVPRIYYYQNVESEFDMTNHVKPFKKAFDENFPLNNNVSYHFYSDSARGHNPQVKSKTIEIINRVFDNN